MAEPVVPTEPVAVTEPKNDSGAPVVTPAAPDEATELRKQLEQATMRANQLANEKAARDKVDEDLQRKKLEEDGEWKLLAEKNAAELQELRSREENATKTAELNAATQEVLKTFPKEVIDIAETAGISLTDDSESARTSLTEKLAAIQARVLPNAPVVTANNPHNPAPAEADTKSLLTRDASGATPMAMAAAKGDLQPTMTFIKGLNVIDQMKRDSGYYK